MPNTPLLACVLPAAPRFSVGCPNRSTREKASPKRSSVPAGVS